MKKHNKTAESLFEILNGLHGYRDEVHTKWEKQAKAHLTRKTKNKNRVLENNTIKIQSANGDRVLYTITIN